MTDPKAELWGFSAPTRSWLDSGRHIVIEDKGVFVHEGGPVEGPAVIFIHGFPTSGFDWRRVSEALSDTFRCVILDMPGYGLSDKPVAYSYSLFQQADVVEGLAQALAITDAHVVSHDVGTSVHTELLARQQESKLGFHILSSTFLNGSILKGMATLTEFQRILETPSLLGRGEEICAGMLPGYVDSLKRLMARPEGLSNEDAVVMTELLAYQEGNRRIPQVYSYVRERYLLKERWVGALVKETGPVQVVWGMDDPVANLAMGRALAELVPRALYTEVPGVGHFMPIEAPDVVARALRSFIPRLTGPSSRLGDPKKAGLGS